MPRLEKTHSNVELVPEARVPAVSPVDWASNNFVNPLINTMCVEPANVVAGVVDKATGQAVAHRLALCPVVAARDCGAEFWSQNFASGLAAVLPYALAGRLAGNAMRWTAAALKFEGGLAGFAASEKSAQIIGAGVYDGLKDAKPGQTQLRNGLAGAVNFSILEWSGNPSGNIFSRSCRRFASGVFAGAAYKAVARPDDYFSKDRELRSDFGRELLSNGVMNVFLPGTQEGIRLLQDRVTVCMGKGMPIDRFIKTNKEMASRNFFGHNESRLIEMNRWARVQPHAADNSYQPGKDLVNLKDGGAARDLLHELQHRKEFKAGIVEPGFVRACNQLWQRDALGAWRTYRAVRLAQEVRAELTHYHDAGLKKYGDIIKELKRSIPDCDAGGGVTYKVLWRKEFAEFLKSRGKYRPEADYSGSRAQAELDSEFDLLHRRLSVRQEDSFAVMRDVVDRGDLTTHQVTQVFKHINDFLVSGFRHPVPVPLTELAMQTLQLTAAPYKVHQGYHPTCGPAALEYLTYLKHPENAANLISQVVRFNDYQCRDGFSVKVDGLNVKPERYWERNHACQLFQNTAVNVYWQRQNSLKAWLTNYEQFEANLKPGLLRYERVQTKQLSESPYRLMDHSHSPPEPILARVSEPKAVDLSDPLMNSHSLEEISEEINDTAYGELTLPEQFASPEHLHDQLKERKARGELPVILVVDSRHPPFSNDMSDPGAGGWHFVVANTFDARKGVVSLFNPWGKIIPEIGVKELFNANQEFEAQPANKE